MDELLGQVVLIIANAGIPVLLGNIAKHFFPAMQGKTDKIVNVLTVGLFVFAWFYGEFYNPNFLYKVLPGIELKAKQIIEILNGLIVLLVSVGLNKPIYDKLVKGRLGIFGKSFDK
jgi:hypothetical protein